MAAPLHAAAPDRKFYVYGASDFAVTSDGGDWTVHALVGIDPDDRMYLLDLWRKRTSTEQWIDSYCELVLRWKPLEWGFEGGQIKSAVGPFLDRRAKERKAFTYIRTFPSRHDKSVRAQAIRGRMAMQGLYVPTHAHWYAEFLGEVLSFPAGKHDDQVDCLSLIGQMLTHISRGHPSAPPKPIKVLSPPPGDDRYIGATLDDLWEIHDSGGSYRRERV